MSIDTAAILAARYHNDPSPLKAAVLGQGDGNINPYAALRALQLQKEAERYQMAQAAMQGRQYQNAPSMVEQALSPTPRPQMQPQQPSMGLGGMPVPEGEYAGGGIVAFAGPPNSEEGQLIQEDAQLTPDMIAQMEENQDSEGEPVTYGTMAGMIPGLMKQVAGQTYTPMSEPEWKRNFEARRRLLEEGAGPSPFGVAEEQLNALNAEREQGLKQAQGMAMLAAAGDVLQPGGLMRGLGAAAKTYASQYGQAMAADKAEQRSLASMRFNIADAKRKEQMGLNREAIAAADQARQDHAAAQKFKLDKTKALASLAISGARATKPTGAGAGGPKGFDNLAATYYEQDKYKNDQLPEDQRQPDAVVKAVAYQRAAADWAKVPAGETVGIKKSELGLKQSELGLKEREAKTHEERAENEKLRIATEQGTKVNEAMTKWDRTREAIESKRDGTYEQKRKQKLDSLREQYPNASQWRTDKPKEEAPSQTRSVAPTKAPAGNKNTPPKQTGGKVVTRADIKATAKASGKTEKEVEAAIKAKGWTIK